jgi:hypothetical protein
MKKYIALSLLVISSLGSHFCSASVDKVVNKQEGLSAEVVFDEQLVGKVIELMKDDPKLFADFFALCQDASHECIVESAYELLIERQLMNEDGTIGDEIKVMAYACFAMICESMQQQGLIVIDEETGSIVVAEQ